jgi:putative endonuclease
MTDVGELGERIVARWLESRGYHIWHHRWHCRWGEIDLIAQEQSTTSLVFVEVKTRSVNNWDANGILSIDPRKQQKLWQTAELFLAQNPALASLPCRFDIALVSYFPINSTSPRYFLGHSSQQPIDKPVFEESGYRLIVQDYLQSAFDSAYG